MQKRNYLITARGSAPLELSSLVVLLLLPLTPMLVLYGEIFDAIAAESIARHSLRLGILQSSGSDLERFVSESISALSDNWGRAAEYELNCGQCQKGSTVTLQVRVGNSVAIQTAGLDPK